MLVTAGSLAWLSVASRAELYPVESVAARLAYETRHRPSTPGEQTAGEQADGDQAANDASATPTQQPAISSTQDQLSLDRIYDETRSHGKSHWAE